LEEELWHLTFSTSTVATLQVAGLGWLTRQAIYHCIVAGVEIDKCATGHEVSNQQSEKAKLPQHNPGSPWENWSLSTTSQLHFFALNKPYLGPF